MTGCLMLVAMVDRGLEQRPAEDAGDDRQGRHSDEVPRMKWLAEPYVVPDHRPRRCVRTEGAEPHRGCRERGSGEEGGPTSPPALVDEVCERRSDDECRQDEDDGSDHDSELHHDHEDVG